MNKNKFFELMMVSAAAAALAVGIVGVSAAAQSNVAAEGNSSDYTMSFSASKNKISAATAETTLSAATDAGNAVNFAYNNSATQMGYWGKFNADGYFKNTSAINGLKSMSLVLGNTNAIKVSYGWSPSTYPVSDIEISAAAAGDTVTYAFGDEKPPYFKLSYDTAQPLIKSMTLTYTCSATANPYWPEAEGLTMTLSSDGNSYYVSGCTKTATSVVINSTYKGKPVTSIGDRAFYGCTGLASVSIPSSVTSIGGYAFSGCTGLTKAEFASFESLCKISFADVSSNPLFYAHHLYIGGSEVTELVIPASVTSIGGYAFSGCSGLTSIDIPSSVTSIGGYAFDACTGLTSVSIPASVTSIGDSAFSGCFRLTSVSIPSSVTSIGDSTFSGCSGLTSVSIPASVTSIGNSAFSGCFRLTSVSIPSSVTSIGSYAFSGCSGLTSVSIPSSVTSIGSYAFSGCTGLTSISIPSSVTSIGNGAFYVCTGLTSVSIPASVTSIGGYAFSGCTGLTSVSILTSVTYIGYYAFSGCSGLTSVSIPSSVTSIGSYAFSGCTGLSIVCQASSASSGWSSTWNSSSCPVTWGAANRGPISSSNGFSLIANWDMSTFISYSGTASQVDIPSVFQGTAITVIPADFAKGNTAATYVRIPDSVTSIASGAFDDCTALKTIVIGSGVTSIDAAAFQGLTAFEGCYYKGTPTQWAALSFTTFGDSVAYYSETTPTDTEHYYWHYDTDNLTPVMY